MSKSPNRGTAEDHYRTNALSSKRGAGDRILQSSFGARELYRVDGEGGAVVAELSVGESVFWLAEESPEHLNFSPESLGGASVRMVMIVNDPDAAFESRSHSRVV